MKRIQRIRQQGLELVGRGDKTDALTENLQQIERKVEGIRNGAQVTSKKLVSSLQGSGSTTEKHIKKLPLHSVGVSMKEAGTQLCSADPKSAFGEILEMVGMAEVEVATQMAHYEIMLSNDVITPLTTMLEEDTKKIDKTRKRLQNARLDMDSTRGRLQSLEKQAEKSNREYQMGKLDTLRTDLDEATRKFEVCQDAYATELFTFMTKEQLYTEKLQDFVRRQVSMLKQGVASLEGMLPTIEKKMKESQERPLFGMSLTEHRKLSKREVAVVIQDCIEALRDGCMDTEGLFRIAGSATKVKFLKNSFNAQQRTASSHDPHTIAGCLKRYIRELSEPILTFELYPEFMQAVQLADQNTTMQKMKDLLSKLPEAHTLNLKYLLAFLHEFSQYHEITKMTTGNIAIVFGPNLLWSQAEMGDTAAVVSDTAMQRRVAELLIENVHTFYPDLPETPQPNFSQQRPPPSFTTSHGMNPSGVYTPTTPLSSYGPPPPTSPNTATSTPSSSTSSSITEDLQAHSSPLQTTPPLVVSHEAVVELRSSSPKPFTASPPIPPKPYKGMGGTLGRPTSNPPSPAPRAANSASSGGIQPWSNSSEPPPVSPPDSSSNGISVAESETSRPHPAARRKLPAESPGKAPGVSPSHGLGSGGSERRSLKGPSRKAPPPPVSKKPGAARQLSNEEISSL